MENKTGGCLSGENKADRTMNGMENVTKMRLLEETQGRNCSAIALSEYGEEVNYASSYEYFPLSMIELCCSSLKQLNIQRRHL